MQHAYAPILFSRASKDPEQIAFFSPCKCEVPFQMGKDTFGSYGLLPLSSVFSLFQAVWRNPP
jgi:hypothetical protein